jgi:hypothetical protein
MAQSIRQQLNNGKVEVTHGNQQAMFELPAWLDLTDSTIDDKDALIEHLEQHGVLMGVLHQGLAQSVIGVRAAARPNKKDEDLDTATQRKKAREWTPGTLPRPKDEVSEATSAIQKLLDKGFTKEQILEMIG